MSIISDLRNSKFMYLIPEYLREDENFLVFFSFLVHEFDITEENIRTYTDLVNPDKVPMEFIEALGSYFNYRYLPNATDEFNREVLMRMSTIWEMRGTTHSILMAAVHGDNDGYVGGDIFIPDYFISNESAYITIPRELVFRHNRSKFSGIHRYPSAGLYAPGIILLSLPYLNERIRRRIYDVTPAGLKYVFELILDFIPNWNLPDDQIGDYGELSFFDWMRIWPKDDIERQKFDNDIDILLDIYMHIEREWEKPSLIFDKRNGVFSGSRDYYNYPVLEDLLETTLGVSMLHMPILRNPFGIDNGTIDVMGATDKAFKHNISEYGKGIYMSDDLLTSYEIADDSKYIILPSGEYYEIGSRDTADHILRRNLDTSIGEFYIHDEDPNLGLVEIEQHEKHILTSDSLYDTPYVGELTYLDYRDNFWNSDVEISDEIERVYEDGIREIIANENIASNEIGQYGELSTYQWMQVNSGSSELEYGVELTYTADSTEKPMVHSGGNAYGKFSGNGEILSMYNRFKVWSPDESASGIEVIQEAI